VRGAGGGGAAAPHDLRRKQHRDRGVDESVEWAAPLVPGPPGRRRSPTKGAARGGGGVYRFREGTASAGLVVS